uniref:Uncharacterized protein n=1 Tax=Anguilla anguilla TaxID=7936 RepID=A0A0E9T5D8_ANGAN
MRNWLWQYKNTTGMPILPLQTEMKCLC